MRRHDSRADTGPATTHADPASPKRGLNSQIGNRAFTRLATSTRPMPGPIQTSTSTTRTRFTARITRTTDGTRPNNTTTATAPTGRSDAAPAEEQDPEDEVALFDHATVQPTTIPNAEDQQAEAATGDGTETADSGEIHHLDDIEIPELAAIEKSDAILGAFSYSGSITRGGAGPTGFGVTRSFGSSLTDITVQSFPAFFMVTATLVHPITYQVRSGTGPGGQVDIASDSDGDITSANYADVVTDLTPNMSDLNGRPPRSQFWAEDLTLRHEKVHADDDHANGPGAMMVALAWLQTQTAPAWLLVYPLLAKIPGKFAAALIAALSTRAGEIHAYGDGAPSYTARANAIKAKGDAGGYP